MLCTEIQGAAMGIVILQLPHTVHSWTYLAVIDDEAILV